MNSPSVGLSPHLLNLSRLRKSYSLSPGERDGVRGSVNFNQHVCPSRAPFPAARKWMQTPLMTRRRVIHCHIRCLQSLRLLLRPIRQLVPLFLRQARCPVNPRVTRQRHIAVTYLLTDPIPFFGRALRIIVRPLREIQSFARIAHVPVQPPRHGRHVSVPRPTRLVGVAIITGRPEHRGNLRWWRIGAQ